MLHYGLLYGSTFYPELNVYDDLKSSGELALLTNPELLRSLATMDSRLELMRIAQADLTAVQQLHARTNVDRLSRKTACSRPRTDPSMHSRGVGDSFIRMK